MLLGPAYEGEVPLFEHMDVLRRRGSSPYESA
jgi:hypothetical protein